MKNVLQNYGSPVSQQAVLFEMLKINKRLRRLEIRNFIYERCFDLMVSAMRVGSIPGHDRIRVVFLSLGKALYLHSVSLHHNLRHFRGSTTF